MNKNAEMIVEKTSSAEEISVSNIEIDPDFSDFNQLIVNPEITQLTCDIYDELQRTRDKYIAKKQELNHRGTTLTDQDKAKLKRLEQRMQEWQDLLNDALKPESH